MMNDDLAPSLDRDEDWGHRRTNIRHEVSLPAVIHDRMVGPIPCLIEDISSTGMLVALDLIAIDPGREPLKPDSQAELVFAPDPVNAPADKVSTIVEIKWRTPLAIGVGFLDISPALRAGLRTIAEAAVEARLSDAKRPSANSADQRRITLACRKTVERLLPNMIWALRTEVAKRLRALAEAASPGDARALKQEADLIDEKANAIGRTVERRFLQGFAAASDLDQTQELMLRPRAGAAELPPTSGRFSALLADGQAERNTRIGAIGHAAEERYKSKYFALNVRLANVIGHRVDPEINPLVPFNACIIFWEATVSHCDSPNVQRCLLYVLQNRVVPLLGELYDAIDLTLDQERAQRIFDMR